MSESSSQQSAVEKSTNASRLAQINIFETCLIVTVLFLACWTTTETALFMYIIDVYEDLSSNHYTTGRLLILLNSCLNPYVYTLRYREFKKQLRVLIGLEKNSNKLNTSVTFSANIP